MANAARPTHGSGAQTNEFRVDLRSHGYDRDSGPDNVTTLISTDASGTLQLEARPTKEADTWRLDLRLVRGSIEPQRAFHNGQTVSVDDLPAWMDIVLEQAEGRLFERDS